VTKRTADRVMAESREAASLAAALVTSVDLFLRDADRQPFLFTMEAFRESLDARGLGSAADDESGRALTAWMELVVCHMATIAASALTMVEGTAPEDRSTFLPRTLATVARISEPFIEVLNREIAQPWLWGVSGPDPK
jgi:hypothetical protein